jgi:hypothetical protein
MDNKCYYLSTRGIPYSCNILLLSINDINKLKITQDNLKIFVKVDFIKHFFTKINLIQNKFILLTGLSDYTLPNDFYPNNIFLNLVNNNRIIHWFAQNCILVHPKITMLPIGLDYHTVLKKNFWWGNKLSPLEQEKELLKVKSNVKPLIMRQIKCYSNFHFVDYKKRFGYTRKDVISIVSKKIVFYEPEKISRIDTWKNQSEYAFVISPHGNGLDCYRTWEALILGCIVIVKTSPLDSLYEDLPIIILNNWKELNQDLLNNKFDEFKNKSFNYDKLTLQYWIEQINRKN